MTRDQSGSSKSASPEKEHGQTHKKTQCSAVDFLEVISRKYLKIDVCLFTSMTL